MSDIHVRVILNPNAAAGRALSRMSELREHLYRYDLSHEIVLTTGPGHASKLAKEARLDPRVQVIALAGGDGTLHEVVQGYLDDDGRPVKGPDLAMIPIGTGGDFRKTLGLSLDLGLAVEKIRHGKRRTLDAAKSRYVDHHGRERVELVANILSFGVGGLVDHIVNTTPKWLGGKASFYLGSARALFRYRNAAVSVRLDGDVWYEGPAFNVVVANGRYFGGGMYIAPNADPSDGKLDIVLLGDLSKTETLSLSNKIYKGTHLLSKGVRTARATRVEAESLHPWNSVLIDSDGEQPGRIPIRVDVVPAAFTFCV